MDHTLTMYEDIPRVGRSYMYDDILFSRDHLCVDCIDAYLIHRDNPKVPVEEIIDTFEEFLRKGWIKAYGMSNWRLDRFVEAYEYCERMGYQGPSVYSPFFSLVKIEKPRAVAFSATIRSSCPKTPTLPHVWPSSLRKTLRGRSAPRSWRKGKAYARHKCPCCMSSVKRSTSRLSSARVR